MANTNKPHSKASKPQIIEEPSVSIAEGSSDSTEGLENLENIEALEEALFNSSSDVAISEDEIVEGPKADMDAIVSNFVDVVNDLAGKEELVEAANMEIPENRRITLRSIYFGEVEYINSMTKAKYLWKEYGATRTMTWADIQSMHNEKSVYLEKPLLFTTDKDVIKYYNLEDVYENMHIITQLENLFISGNLVLIRQRLRDLVEVGLETTAIAKIRKLRESKVLTNKDIIDAIKDELKLDLD
jgi:hypothetical protein